MTWLYDQVTGDEDSRVCKDIPDEACHDQPRNFFAYLFANIFNKIADELVSARLTLPWLFNALGIPLVFVSYLVPIREAGVLIPQLFVAAYIRLRPYRKPVWIIGATLSGLSLLLMAVAIAPTSWQLTGVTAGWMLLLLLVLYSLARGLCSVSAKDVLGKTISKTRRGRLMGYTASLSGLATLLIGFYLQFGEGAEPNTLNVLFTFVLLAALFWLFALASFSTINETAGATEGGGNALDVAKESLTLVTSDNLFRQYLVSRMLLLSIALVIPFYVLLIQNTVQQSLAVLGWLIIAGGLASSLSAPLIGKLADKSSRLVMAIASLLAGIIGLLTQVLFTTTSHTILLVSIFFLITLAHGAARLGRKVYIVDMATQENRAQYVALSNTLIGCIMLIAGMAGIIGDLFSIEHVILVFSLVSLVGSIYIFRIKEVSG